MEEQKTTPIKYSKGGISIEQERINIIWRENGIKKMKSFRYCKKKRTDEETLKIANDFYKTIEEKHKLWTEYITPIRTERKKETEKNYKQTQKAKDQKKEYRARPEVKEKTNEWKRAYVKKQEVKDKINKRRAEKRIEAVFNNIYRCNECHHSYSGDRELNRHLKTNTHELKKRFNVVLKELMK